MMAYLDTNIVIYAVETPPVWGQKVALRLGDLCAAGYDTVTSDASRIEALVLPYRKGDTKVLGEFAAFFADPNLMVFPLTAAVCERAARIRALYRYQTMDSLHLAAAVENGCDLFVTNDVRLASFPDITIDLLT